MTAQEFKTRHDNNETQVLTIAKAQELRGRRVAAMLFPNDTDLHLEFTVGELIMKDKYYGGADDTTLFTCLRDSDGIPTGIINAKNKYNQTDVFGCGGSDWHYIVLD